MPLARALSSMAVASAITALVTFFGELTKDTDSILRLATAIVDCVEDESVDSILPSVQANK